MIKSLQNKFLLFLAIVLLVTPAYAANSSLDTINVVDQPYTNFQIFGVMFSLGLIFFIISMLASREQNADAFAAMAIIPLFISAWMAMQLDFPTRALITSATDSTIWTQHNIYPSIFLTIVSFVLGVLSILQLYRLLTTDTVESTGWKAKWGEQQDPESGYDRQE